MTSKAESVVKDLNELRAKASKLEDWKREMRLGAKHEFRKIGWRDMVFAFGWSHRKSEPLPDGMEHEFYEFLNDRLSVLGEKIRKRESELNALGGDD